MASTVPLDDALVRVDLQGKLKHLASGKVREVYEIDDDSLLFIATDRISAYDVIMDNGIPMKGALLTAMSNFWFAHLSKEIPSLRTHFISLGLPSDLASTLPGEAASQLTRRAMRVRRLKPFALESIVRGYITGSAWAEYKQKGTVHGIKLSEGLREGDKLDEPLWTPSTKAEAGGKDQNLHPDQANDIVGPAYAAAVRTLSLKLYTAAHAYALTRGIVIADTKFEFAPDPDPPAAAAHGVVLIDEVLTPDSSRFWPLQSYRPGGPQASFDKQFLRDWLVENGLKGKEGVKIPEEVVRRTAEKYGEAFKVLTGESLEGV